MIEALRRHLARPAADDWLLLRPSDAGPWRWLHWRAGQLLAEGDWPPARHDETLRRALLVPATACSQFEVAAPPGVRPSEWPLLLEDRLLQPPEAVQVTCVGRHAGRLRLLVVERSRLTAWQQAAAEHGMRIERCWSEYQLLPDIAPGQTLVWPRDGYRCVAGLDEAGLPYWFAWPDPLGPWTSADGAQELPRQAPGGPGQPLASLADLTPGHRARRPSASSRGLRRLAALCAVCALAWGLAQLGQTYREGEQGRVRLAERLGGVTTPPQAEARLRRLQRDDQAAAFRQQQLAALGSAVDALLAAAPGVQLEALGFDGRHWTLTLSGADGSLSDGRRWDALGEALGMTATLEQDGTQLTARFDLDTGGDS
ncbi:hypothetical protein DN820_07430 [Stutzerimonas nosocomialis]|uniref:Uncharacterized protein n=1 Tax=Stutzerimonas nosocomialis TaxID=1056496 RepID=A0A5R9QG79_9GAMM|nr:type II secretion system protein GspL [Stutzerimonas nosocomialis]TLX64141.1 hypothetical protein DN820_07430 [Stutzerimonas nosocomialis]